MRLSLFCLLCLVTSSVLGQAPKLIAVPCKVPPVIDGFIDTATEWKDVKPYEALVDSQSGAVSGERTQLWLCYDSKFIYLAVHAEEKDQINASEYRVNAALDNEDHITFGVDFSGTMSDFNYFSVNPLGATSIRLAGGRAAKREWLGEFVAKGHVFPGGYEVEARIPWALMKRGHSGMSDLRINFSRFHQHNQRSDTLAFTRNNLINNTPYWIGVDLPKEREAPTLKLLPYAYVGWDKEQGHIADAGLDLKTPVTDRIELVGSINPDFKNIESQLLSLDFSRFERLSSEVRPFFLEGRSYLNTALFASQRIERFDAGLNTYGKLDDKTSFGLIDTWLVHKEEDIVFNLSRNPTPNDQLRISYAGQNRPDVKNDGYLARYYRNFGPFSALFRTMGTKDADNGFGQSQYASVSYNKNPWGIYSDYTYTEASFSPRLGFVPEVDLKGPSMYAEYNPLFEKGTVAQVDLNVYGGSFQHIDGSFYRNEGTINASFQHRKTGLQPSASIDWQDFEGQKDRLVTTNLEYPYNNGYRNVYAGYSFGTAATLPYRTASFGGRYRTLRNKLDLSLSAQTVSYQGYADQIIFTANYDLGKDQSISGRIVKAGGNIGPYIAYRKAGNRGAEYFLLVGNPNTEQFRTAVVLKVTVPFEIALKKRA